MLQWIAVHLQQRIAKPQNHNQIVRYEYHYQFTLAKLALSLGKQDLATFFLIEPLLIPVGF